MKRILMIGPVPIEIGGSGDNTTGVANVALALSKELSKDNEIFFYGTNLSKEKSIELSSSCRIKYEGYELFDPYNFPLIKLLALYKISKNIGFPFKRLVFYFMNLNRIFKQQEFDIIHVHNVLFLPLVRFLTDAPTVVTYHGNFYKDKAGIAFNKSRGVDVVKLYENTLNLVDNATFLTPSMMRQYKRDLGLQAKFSKVISNGINSSSFVYSNSLRIALRKKLGISNKDFVFITVGSVQERKGQERFINFIRRSNWNVKYIIVGKGPDSKKISKLINEIGVGSMVKLINFVNNDELIQYYSCADAYAHVSTAEGQAMSALEAKCSGLPLLISSEIIETMGNYIDECTSIIDFDKSENNLLNEIKESSYLINRSEIDRESYSWTAIAQKYEEFYNECLQH